MIDSPITARAATVSGARRSRALFVAALVLALALLTLNFGLIDLIDGFTGIVDQSRNVVLDAGWGAIFGVVLPLGLLAQLRRAWQRIAGLQQTALVAVVLAGAGVAGGALWYLALPQRYSRPPVCCSRCIPRAVRCSVAALLRNRRSSGWGWSPRSPASDMRPA